MRKRKKDAIRSQVKRSQRNARIDRMKQHCEKLRSDNQLLSIENQRMEQLLQKANDEIETQQFVQFLLEDDGNKNNDEGNLLW